ncbi:hypothetical protein [Geodermatophilus marinus]|uniref:hypothetical protein n=1 Tax=Geodermatophilus sp. LHW52908 TaxID=2303986 RepID=UPI000E3D6991|nr:hypothetical protein [Geodermatophilus sp. LHW52908]RFU22197.1 hypothetical protein D0Z06_05810 [Geodermatophilus sp. LHW52908]
MRHEAAPTTAPGDRFADVRPQSPGFTATLDQRAGAIRVRGHLDAVTADLLRGGVLALQGLGHRHVTVRLMPAASVDAEACRLLADLAERLGAEGVRLEVRSA